MRYHQAKDGDWIQPKRRGYKMACCDCGLVHVLNFRVRNGQIQFQPTRDNRATGQRRRQRALATGVHPSGKSAPVTPSKGHPGG